MRVFVIFLLGNSLISCFNTNEFVKLQLKHVLTLNFTAQLSFVLRASFEVLSKARAPVLP